MKPLSIASVWDELEEEGKKSGHSNAYRARALGASAVGIRAGYRAEEDIIELLVEIPQGWAGERVLPEWRGMGNEVADLHLPPRKDAPHLRLFLTNSEHRDIFTLVCDDLVDSLEGIVSPESRVEAIEECLLRWRRFFQRSGGEGLSIDRQQGLFAELAWLANLLENGIDHLEAVDSWKGCERSFHDFDLWGKVIEVKSTRKKEPVSLTISNERQLDEADLRSLHLYALFVHLSEGNGSTLTEKVAEIRSLLSGHPLALDLFKNKLVAAGFLDKHAERYTRGFISRSENLFRVTDGFPRITAVPLGVGNLNYSILLSACEPFRVDIEEHLAKLKRAEH